MFDRPMIARIAPVSRGEDAAPTNPPLSFKCVTHGRLKKLSGETIKIRPLSVRLQ
jgi:hypothetical protein